MKWNLIAPAMLALMLAAAVGCDSSKTSTPVSVPASGAETPKLGKDSDAPKPPPIPKGK